MTPGERQTVDIIDHPWHGECRAVYRNGNTFLLVGKNVVEVGKIGFHSASAKGSFIKVTHLDGEHRICRVITHGDRHDRYWSPWMGEGWLIFLSKDTTGKVGSMRFEADNGQHLDFTFSKLSVGTPAYAAKLERARTKMPEITVEEQQWETFTTQRGEVLAFRRDGPPPPDPESEEVPESQQTELPL